MLTSRLLEDNMVTLQRHGRLSTYAGSSGQEALYVAIGNTLLEDDIHVPYYRDQPCMLMRGYKPIDIIRYWSGSERGNTVPYGDLPICVPIATQCLHAAGAAFALKFQQKKNVALVTLGDGATSKGDFYEALNFSSLNNLPIIFVINDNGWAISTPIEKQTKCIDLSKKATFADMISFSIDGTDLFTCIDTLKKARELALNGKPVLLHAKTVRLCDHTTADDAKKYKTSSILQSEKAHDPIKKIKAFITQELSWTEQQDKALVKTIQAEINHALALFNQDTIEHPATMFEHCYADMPEQLKRQKEEFLV